MDIFERITALLKEKNITRIKLCEDTCISYLTLSTIYKRKSDMSGRMIKTIADYLGTTADYLITGDISVKEKATLDPFSGQKLPNILIKFNSLNLEGRKKVEEYIEDLLLSKAYSNDDTCATLNPDRNTAL